MKNDGAKFWSRVPAVLLVTLVGGLGTVAYVTSNDPSFAVERNYYEKAVRYDETRAQDETNAQLGWHVELDTRVVGSSIELRASVKDAQGKPVPGPAITAEGFAIARSSNVSISHFMPEPGATQSARMPLVTTGLWELRFTVEAGGKRFTEVLRREIGKDDT